MRSLQLMQFFRTLGPFLKFDDVHLDVHEALIQFFRSLCMKVLGYLRSEGWRLGGEGIDSKAKRTSYNYSC